jgi:ubiquinone/menaquinone biosynthesis C-methylase UbiE
MADWKELEKTCFIFPRVDLELEHLIHEGLILDIAGGGEGVIGQLMGEKVVAIDYQEGELLEAAEGPLKIVMDARELKFLDNCFQVVTAFFAFMYIKSEQDQLKIFQEIHRVLKPGGVIHIWDIDIFDLPETDKDVYVLNLVYKIRGKSKETGYGMPKLEKPRGLQYYLDMAKKTGFKEKNSELIEHTFYSQLVKE